MDDIQECIRVIPETGHFIMVDFPSFIEADLNKKGDGMDVEKRRLVKEFMKSMEYVVEIKCYQEVQDDEVEKDYVDAEGYMIRKKTITVQAVSEAQARSKAINHGMELHPEIYDVEVVSIKKGQ